MPSFKLVLALKGRLLSRISRTESRSRVVGWIRICLLLGLAVGIIGRFAWRGSAASDPLTITTVAGGGVSGVGLFANLQAPKGVAFYSGSSNIAYIADTGNHVVRKIDLNTSTTDIVAGQLGVSSISSTAVNGDGGAATAATLKSPSDVAVDSSGNLYIADTGNNRIRRVDAATHNITTLAGTGVTGSGGGTDGAVGSATFNQPTGLAIDTSGRIYVADKGDNRVRRISNGLVEPYAGTGTAGNEGDGISASLATLNAPTDVAVGSDGSLYIVDAGNNRVRKVDVVSGNIEAFAGNGVLGVGGDSADATSVPLSSPASVTIDDNGNIFISESGTGRLRKVSAGGITTVAGTGAQGYDGDGSPATARLLNTPTGIAARPGTGEIYFLDAGNRRLRKVTLAGSTLATVLSDGSSGYAGDGGAATSANLNFPSGVAVDSAGNYYIADTSNHVIRKVAIDTGIITTIAGTGVASTDATATNGDGALAVNATLNRPVAVAVDTAGNVYVADNGNNRIRKIATSGFISTVAGVVAGSGGTAISNVQAITVDPTGIVYFADAGSHVVRKISGGNVTLFAGTPNVAGFTASALGDGGAATSAKLNAPAGLATDSSGNVYFS